MLFRSNNLSLSVGRVEDIYSEDYKSLFPETLNERIEKKNNLNSRKQSVAAYLLLQKILMEYYGATLESLRFSENGKPYLECGPQISVSHTDNYVCVGVSFSPVGVDIEQLRDFDEKIAKRYFSKAENQYISKDNSIFRFFKLWTVKEAIIKLEGTSISQMAEIKTKLLFGKPFYKNYKIHTETYENCIISVCFSKKTGK